MACRTVLADLAQTEPLSFRAVTRAALPGHEPRRSTVRIVERLSADQMGPVAQERSAEAMAQL